MILQFVSILLISVSSIAFAVSSRDDAEVYHCYYSEPLQPVIDEDFFQQFSLKSYSETFENMEIILRKNAPYSHHFQFKYPLNKVDAETFAKVLLIKAQEAHRFVPVISFSKFLEPAHLGFIRDIEIENSGIIVQEHALIDKDSLQVIFIEEWMRDPNGVMHPGDFAAINSIIEENGEWYFAGTYMYKNPPDISKIPDIIQMFQKTYENMIFFIESEDVDAVYKTLKQY